MPTTTAWFQAWPPGGRVAGQPDQDAVLEGEAEVVLRGRAAGRQPTGEGGEPEPAGGPDHPAATRADALRCQSQPPLPCSATTSIRLGTPAARTVDRLLPSAKPAPNHQVSAASATSPSGSGKRVSRGASVVVGVRGVKRMGSFLGRPVHPGGRIGTVAA